MDMKIRQGTVYLEKASGRRFVLVNHNFLALESLRFWSASETDPFDLGAPERINNFIHNVFLRHNFDNLLFNLLYSQHYT